MPEYETSDILELGQKLFILHHFFLSKLSAFLKISQKKQELRAKPQQKAGGKKI